MKRQSKQAAVEVLANILTRAPEWLAAGRLKSRRIGLSLGSSSVIVWQEPGKAFPA